MFFIKRSYVILFSFLVFGLFGCGTPCPESQKVDSLSSARITELSLKISKLSPEGKSALLNKLLKVTSKDYDFAPKQLLVKFKSDTAESKIRSILGVTSSNAVYRFQSNGTLLIQVGSVTTKEELLAVAAAMAEVESVEYVHPNSRLKIVQTPDDPLFKDQEALHNTGTNGLKARSDIDALEAWKITTGSESVVVGVIDTGIDYNHPDLAQNIWLNPGEVGLDSQGRDKRNNGIDDDGNGYVDDFRGWDFVNNDNDPMDDQSHGTHVAGTIGAVGNNGVGITGVSWNVRLAALKFLDSSGSGFLSDAIRAIEYANSMNIAITNNSWGGGGFDPALEAAIRSANEKGFLFVAAAGNETNNNDKAPSYPASYEVPNILAVAAVNSADTLADFSNFGFRSVHIAAPGVNILSTLPGDQYGRFSGTSMAAPHVAGAAALIRSKFPDANAKVMKSRLIFSAKRIPELMDKVASGRLNAFQALEEDNVPPSPVLGTQIFGTVGFTRAEITWLPSGDDGSAGEASSYEIRIATNPIQSQENWDRAKAVQYQHLPSGSPDRRQARIIDLPVNFKGFVAIKAFDNVGNEGALGNSIALQMSPPSTLFENKGENFTGLMREPANSWGQEDIEGRGKVFSDSPGRLYDSNSESAILLPPIHVWYPDLILNLATKVNCESGFDWAYIEYVKNNETLWKEIASYSAENCEWANLRFQLGDLVNANDQIRIRFRFKTDEVEQREGWLIDDIKVEGIAPPEIPTNFTAQPFHYSPARLSWIDTSSSETFFELKGSRFLLRSPRNTTEHRLNSRYLPRNLSIRACNGVLCSPFSPPVVIRQAPPEALRAIPSSVGLSGGQKITLRGVRFTRLTRVLIGERPCSNLRFINSSTVTCITPPQIAEGRFEVKASYDGQVWGQLPAQINYVCSPQISGGIVGTHQQGGILYRTHTFSNVGNHQLKVSQVCGNIEVLVVGGGGGGGIGRAGAGGGAGGLNYQPNFQPQIGLIPLVVGKGGGPSANGTSSSFGNLVGLGGGRGGNGERRPNQAGSPGGSGGGGGFKGGWGGAPAAMPGQGNAGGNNRSGNWIAGGGGGGAGGRGQSGFGNNRGSGGAGGQGVIHAISGTPRAYAGGGGGCGQHDRGLAGSGVGGTGGRDGIPGAPGVASTGGGGGGCGGTGGSGVVIVRYRIN